MGLSFAEVDIVGPKDVWRALVVTPTAQAIVDRSRLEPLRRDQSPGELDRQILARVRAGADRLDLVIFRGTSDDGQGRWGLSEALTPGETEELAHLLSLSQIETYRRFLAAGLVGIIHVEFDPVTLRAFKDASRRLADELEERSHEDSDRGRIAAADRWILKNLTFYFGVSFQAAVTRLLPDKIGLLDAGVRRMRELVEQLPTRAID